MTEARSPDHLRKVVEHMRDLRYASETFTVSVHDIAKFASAIGAVDPVHYRPEAAAAQGLRAVVAPRAFHMSLGTMRGRIVARSDYSLDGLPSEENLEDARLVVGGGSTRFFDDIYAGDTVTVEQMLGTVRERTGRSGSMLLVEVERRYRRADGTLLVLEVITRIVR